MSVIFSNPIQRLPCYVVALSVAVLWTFVATKSRCAEIVVFDAQQLNSPKGARERGYITSLAFSLDDSCLIAVRRTTPVFLRPFDIWQGEYLIFELNEGQRREVAIPLGSSSYARVLSLPASPPVNARHDDVLYVQGPSSIEIGWVKSKKSVASFEYGDKGNLQSFDIAIDPGLGALAIAGEGLRNGHVWTSRGRAELWELSPTTKKVAYESEIVGFHVTAFSSDGKVAFGGGETVPIEMKVGEELIIGGPKSYRGEVHIWKVADGEKVRSIDDIPEEKVLSLAFSPDGKTLVTGGSRVVDGSAANASVTWWDVASGERKGQLFLDTPARIRDEAFGNTMVFDCAYSPSGDIIAVAVGSWHRKAEWGEVRLIDVSSKTVISTPWEKACLWCQNVAFSHNGRMLAASTFRGDVMLWKIDRRDKSD